MACGAGMTDPVPQCTGLTIVRQGASAVISIASTGPGHEFSAEMCAALAKSLPDIARDPMVYVVVVRSGVSGVFPPESSDGGPALAGGGRAAARDLLAARLRLCWMQDCFSKPTVSLVAGSIGGTRAALSLYGTHRVAAEDFSFALPETGSGLVPDCGLLRWTARLPAGIGAYLALTGRAIGAADAHALGLVTHIVGQAHFPAIEAALADADPVDPILDDLHADDDSRLLAESARIARFFEAGSLDEILGRLTKAGGADKAWAEDVLRDLERKSPLALAVTQRTIQKASRLDLRETLIQDYRIGSRWLGRAAAGRPGREGGEAAPAAVERFFAPLEDGDLGLPTRSEMQTARI
jgi:enoyl-CoA hydratase